MKSNDSYTPIYYKLAEDIKQQILSGKFKPGDMIPSESQLCCQYNISRMTARQGIKLLAKEGIIESHRGRGSFVTNPNYNELIIEMPASNSSSTKNIEMRLLESGIKPAGDTVSSNLKLNQGSKIIYSHILFLKNGRPLALENRYISYRRGHPAPAQEEVNRLSFPAAVTKRTGLMTTQNQVSFSAILIDEETAGLLQTAKGKPGLKIEQLVFGTKDQPLGWSVIIGDGERYKLNAITKNFFEK